MDADIPIINNESFGESVKDKYQKTATKEQVYAKVEELISFIKQDGCDISDYNDYKKYIDILYFSTTSAPVFLVDDEKFLYYFQDENGFWNSQQRKCRIFAFKDNDSFEPVTGKMVFVYMPVFMTGVLQNGSDPLQAQKAVAAWYDVITE